MKKLLKIVKLTLEYKNLKNDEKNIMKKLKIFITFVVVTILFVTEILAGESSTTTISELITKTTDQLLLEGYVPKLIIHAKWGSKVIKSTEPVEGPIVGVPKIIEVERREPISPEEYGVYIHDIWPIYPGDTISVVNDVIYILDPLTARIMKYNKDGKYLSSIKLLVDRETIKLFWDEGGVSEMHVDSQENIYIYPKGTYKKEGREILIFDKNGNLTQRYALGWNYNCTFYVDSKNKLFIQKRTGKFHSENPPGKRWETILEPYFIELSTSGYKIYPIDEVDIKAFRKYHYKYIGNRVMRIITPDGEIYETIVNRKNWDEGFKVIRWEKR